MKQKNFLVFVLFVATTLNATPSLPQKPSQPSSNAAQTVVGLFGSLATLLQNDQNPTFVAQFLNESIGAVLTLISQASDKKGVELDLFLAEIKTECKELLNKHITALENGSEIEEFRRPHNEEKDHATTQKDPAATQAILCNVANIVAGVVTIAQDPHDKENVKQSVGKILCSIIGIALNASHRSSAHPLLHCYIACATAENLA